jgi:hypothetical protein
MVFRPAYGAQLDPGQNGRDTAHSADVKTEILRIAAGSDQHSTLESWQRNQEAEDEPVLVP